MTERIDADALKALVRASAHFADQASCDEACNQIDRLTALNAWLDEQNTKLLAKAATTLATARREGLEEAAKVVADYKQKQRAARLPNSASAYDTWHDYTCGQLEAAIRALLSQSVEGNNA